MLLIFGCTHVAVIVMISAEGVTITVVVITT